ncbi:MAG TPA: ABC transporter permease subunit [Roseiflexaceae bacterium]|nr:ABC transporter permease subunit [Roseiflexaceae bacterium]
MRHTIAFGLRLLARALLPLLLLAPLLIFVLHAFSVRWFYPQLLPQEWTLEPLRRVLGSPQVRLALLESLGIALTASGLSLLLGYPAARALVLRSPPGARLIELLLFLPTIVPPVAVGLGLNILFLRIGLAGTRLGVVLVHLIPVLPYTIFSLTGVLARYDQGYEQQALVLGAGPARIFATITLPLLLPGLAVAGLLAFLVSWSQYLLTLLIGGGRVITLPLLLFSAVSGGNLTTIAILSLLFVAPPLAAILLALRLLGGGRPMLAH